MAKWNAPAEIIKGTDTLGMNDENLEFYHDQMHIFWKKIEEGIWFASDGEGWTFKEVHLMHKAIVIEMLKRKISHLHPINSLDNIVLAQNIEELVQIANLVKK